MSNVNNLVVIVTFTKAADCFENVRLTKAYEEVFEHPIEVEKMDHSYNIVPDGNRLNVKFKTSFDDSFNQLHYDCLNLLQFTKELINPFKHIAFTIVKVESGLNVIDAWSWEDLRALNYNCCNRVEEEGGDLVELQLLGRNVRNTDLISECETILREHESHFELGNNIPVIYNYSDYYPGFVEIQEDIEVKTPEFPNQTALIESINKATDEENAKVTDPVQKSFLARLWNTFSGRE